MPKTAAKIWTFNVISADIYINMNFININLHRTWPIRIRRCCGYFLYTQWRGIRISVHVFVQSCVCVCVSMWERKGTWFEDAGLEGLAGVLSSPVPIRSNSVNMTNFNNLYLDLAYPEQYLQSPCQHHTGLQPISGITCNYCEINCHCHTWKQWS